MKEYLSLLCLFLGLIFSSGLVVYHIRKARCALKEKSSFKLLVDRLNNYSLLKGGQCSGENCVLNLEARNCGIAREFPYPPARPILAPPSHEVLLGVLKKIEAKSAALAGVIIFLLASMLAGGYDIASSTSSPQYMRLLFWFTTGFLVGPLVSVIDGAGHLGQPHYVKKSKKVATHIRAREMQKWLMVDLVVKEYAFRQTVWLAAVSILGVLLVFFLASTS